MGNIGLESFSVNVVTCLANLTLVIANRLILRKVTREKETFPRKSASFVQSQTTFYLCSNLFMIIFSVSQITATLVPTWNISDAKVIINWSV